MTALLTTEDALMLDEMLGHEAGCESKHDMPVSLACSTTVTHRFWTLCGVGVLICTNSATAQEGRIAKAVERHGTCSECRRPVEDDWKVTPA